VSDNIEKKEETVLKAKSSRRNFLKGAALGVASVTVAAVVAKKAVIPASDAVSREQIEKEEARVVDKLTSEKYIEMKGSEKAGLVDFFEKSYKEGKNG